MIPKIVHYIWFGKEKPGLVNKCIQSIYECFKDYDIKEWNEDDIDISIYDPILKSFWEESYKNKKYAYCSDISRLYILKEYGGIYIDTDYEFIKPLPDSFLNTNFLARNNPSQKIGNGIWGCNKDDLLVNASIRWFSQSVEQRERSYGKSWIFNNLLNTYFDLFGYDRDSVDTQKVLDYTIYSNEVLCPKNRLSGKVGTTENTLAIHHYHNSWIRE